MPQPIYIVSGFPRCGTSMMMRAIDTGGIPAHYTTNGDENRNRNTLIPGYVPNPHGFFENADLSEWTQHRGHVVKVIRNEIDQLPTDETLRIVYMRRDALEIRRSYVGICSGHLHPTALDFLDRYEADVCTDLINLRTLGEVVVLDYEKVVFEPVKQLSRLGWPIDVAAAARTIEPALYRHRVSRFASELGEIKVVNAVSVLGGGVGWHRGAA